MFQDMASHLEVLLGNIHECLDVGAVEAFPIILDLKSTVEGLSDHDLGMMCSWRGIRKKKEQIILNIT